MLAPKRSWPYSEPTMNTQAQRRAKRIAQHLWTAGCITIKAKPTFRWASGLISPIYTDNRLLLSVPKARDGVIAGFIELIQERKLRPKLIAGVATSGIPLGAILADRLKLPFAYVRPKPKDHGQGRQVEGKIPQGVKTLLIEDLISTGGSSLTAAQALSNAGAKVSGVLATFAYHPDLAGEYFKNAGYSLLALCDAATLLSIGEAKQHIGSKQRQVAEQFMVVLLDHLKKSAR